MTRDQEKERARKRKWYQRHKVEVSARRRAKKIALIVEEWSKNKC